MNLQSGQALEAIILCSKWQPLGSWTVVERSTSRMTHSRDDSLPGWLTSWPSSWCRLLTESPGKALSQGPPFDSTWVSPLVTWAPDGVVFGSQESIWDTECHCCPRLEPGNSGSVPSTIFYCLRDQRVPIRFKGKVCKPHLQLRGMSDNLQPAFKSTKNVNYDCPRDFFFYNIRL